jgi:hypothetical protein
MRVFAHRTLSSGDYCTPSRSVGTRVWRSGTLCVTVAFVGVNARRIHTSIVKFHTRCVKRSWALTPRTSRSPIENGRPMEHRGSGSCVAYARMVNAKLGPIARLESIRQKPYCKPPHCKRLGHIRRSVAIVNQMQLCLSRVTVHCVECFLSVGGGFTNELECTLKMFV